MLAASTGYKQPTNRIVLVSKLFPFFLLAGVVASFAVHADIPASERAALDLLYSSTNGSSWTHHEGWGGAAGTECIGLWYGVTCNNTSPGTNTSHVTQLGLSNNHLTGTLPSLSGLPMLLSVYLDSNQLTGGLPSLSGLTQVQIFYVYANNLTVPMPLNLLSGITTLRYFNVSENPSMGGSIPTLSGLSNLLVFDVSGNNLTGSIPDMSSLTSLNDFVVNFNHLTGPLPAPPSQLTMAGHSAALCPNSLETVSAYEAQWNAATHTTPWWNTLGNPCDGVLANGFE